MNQDRKWWEIFSCPTPEALFDKLLETAAAFHTCRLLQKSGADDLTEQEEAKVEQTRQYFRNLRADEKPCPSKKVCAIMEVNEK